MGVIALISNAFAATKEIFGYASKRTDLKNTAPMEQAAEAKTEAQALAKTNAAIAKGDIEEVRNELAE
jgi:hypothetical protein